MEVMEFDHDNLQEEYKHMAKDMYGEYVVGWIVIEQPWYSNEKDWIYYIVRNKYSGYGFCGGCSDLGLEKIIVDSSTIEPYTQIAKIKYNLSKNITTKLIKEFDFFNSDNEEQIALIKTENDIPYDLWNK